MKPSARPIGRTAQLLGLLLVAGVSLAGTILGQRLWARHVGAPRAEGLIAALRGDPVVIAAIREQNRRLAATTEDDTEAMDAKWRTEKSAGGGPLIQSFLGSPASLHVADLISRQDVVRLIIVMDDRGRNVAVSAPTTDYFQGDEPKWLETFGRPSGHRHVAPLELGHDGRFFACWVSEPLNDPATGEALGAIAVEIDEWRTGGVLCRP
jgi:hypothetical protein